MGRSRVRRAKIAIDRPMHFYHIPVPLSSRQTVCRVPLSLCPGPYLFVEESFAHGTCGARDGGNGLGGVVGHGVCMCSRAIDGFNGALGVLGVMDSGSTWC